jgi:hypothetical protein
MLARAIDSEVHWLGWLDDTPWTEDEFREAVRALQDLAGAELRLTEDFVPDA